MTTTMAVMGGDDGVGRAAFRWPRSYAPSEVGSAVSGNGNADKAQVQAMVARILGLAKQSSADAADALAIRSHTRGGDRAGRETATRRIAVSILAPDRAGP